jgi:nucleotide-binding universal stress UspA family protein
MLRFLVAIDHTVESSFALRAACCLARARGGTVEAFHVLSPETRLLDYGAGWTIHTYNRERVRDAYLDMAGVIASEKEAYGTLLDLKVVFGNAIREIVREVSAGPFDFLFMGSVHALEGPHHGILLKLLMKTACPLITLRHFRPLRKALLFLDDRQAAEKAVTETGRLLQGLPVQLHVVCDPRLGRENEGQAFLKKMVDRLSFPGMDVQVSELTGDPAAVIPECAPDYDLLIMGVPRKSKPNSLVIRMLQSLSTPLLLCR